MWGRIFLMLLGFALIYLGAREVLEPLLMIPMGLGMSAINAGVMFLEGGKAGTLFVDPLMSNPTDLVNIMQINWLQPIYTLTFSNGLIACFVFMGIGVLLDVGYVMARPFQSMFIALFAELGTIAVFPIAVWLGMTPREAASVATIGGADGPDGAFYFADTGQASVCADHGGWLSVPGTHLWRLPVPHQVVGA
jgi:Na+-transporting methylmalonyl-CoA/oxaloacetate decarboxylase beta subunit